VARLLLLIGIFWVLGWWAAVAFGYKPPPATRTLIKIRRGTVRVARGDLRPETFEYVSAILAESAMSEGFIALTSSRVAFSRNIPVEAHQRLRNVLLNQWR